METLDENFLKTLANSPFALPLISGYSSGKTTEIPDISCVVFLSLFLGY